MFAPDRFKIFADVDVNNSCSIIGCMMYRPDINKCFADNAASCPRTSHIAGEINRFMADNDDVFMYIKEIKQ